MNYNDVIGVKMNSEDSISSSGISLRETADKIAADVVSSRPGMKVQWRPYIVQEGVTYEGICSNIAFDAKAFYPYASEGDFVYTGCNIELEKDFPYSFLLTYIKATETALLSNAFALPAISDLNSIYLLRGAPAFGRASIFAMQMLRCR